MAALIRQANSWHQMKETKQLKPPQNPKRLRPTCKHKVEKEKEKNTQKHHQITTVWQTTVCNKGLDDSGHKSTEQK